MDYSYEEMVEMAKKLRAGEVVEVDGVRIRAHEVGGLSITSIACARCNVNCNENYPILCTLTDRNPVTRKIDKCHYLEIVNP